jgi:hypothetical protein
MSEMIVCNPKGELEEIPSDYPFLKQVRAQQLRLKSKVTSYVYEKLTVHVNGGDHSNDIYSKVYQSEDILSKLSPFACKILIYIGYKMEYKAIRIKMNYESSGMSKRTFYKAINELIGLEIIRKIENKKEWYWVNVTVLVVGSIKKEKV